MARKGQQLEKQPVGEHRLIVGEILPHYPLELQRRHVLGLSEIAGIPGGIIPGLAGRVQENDENDEEHRGPAGQNIPGINRLIRTLIRENQDLYGIKFRKGRIFQFKGKRALRYLFDRYTTKQILQIRPKDLVDFLNHPRLLAQLCLERGEDGYLIYKHIWNAAVPNILDTFGVDIPRDIPQR